MAAKQDATKETRLNKKRRNKVNPPSIAESTDDLANLDGLIDSYTDPPVAHSGVEKLPSSQRRALAGQIGEVQGNQYLQKLMAVSRGQQSNNKTGLCNQTTIMRQRGNEPIISFPLERDAQPLTYQLVISGRTFRLNEPELGRELGNIIRLLDVRIESDAEAHQNYIDHYHTPVIADICDWVGDVRMPPVSMWNEPQQLLRRARAALHSQAFREAVYHIREAAKLYEARHQHWMHYKEGTQSGGESTATSLRVFSTIAITVSTTVLTGAPGVASTTLGRAATGALISGTAAELREIGVEIMESVVGVEPEFNWERFITSVASSSVSGFVSTLVGGALRPLFERLFPLECSRETFMLINHILEDGGVQPITRVAMQSYFSRAGARIITSIPQTILAEAFRTTIRRLDKSNTRDKDSFMKVYIRNLELNGVGRIIGQALLATIVTR